MSDKEFHNTLKWKGNYVANFILKFAEVLPDEAEKALCLDLDMFVLCDLRELFLLSLQDKIAAVAENLHIHATGFNSGFVLFNVQEWRTQNLQAKSIAFLQANNPKCPDQDTLNAMIPKDKRLLLPATYNFFPYHKNLVLGVFQGEGESPSLCITRKEYEMIKNEVKIVHFLECAKPWHSQFQLIFGKICLSCFRGEWWQNALKTPLFQEELLEIFKSLKEKEVEELACALLSPARNCGELFQRTSLEYRLGFLMVTRFHTKRDYFILPFMLLKEALKYKIAKKFYQLLSSYAPKLDNIALILEICQNDPAILRSKNHLSYRLGVALLEAHKTWYKGGYIKFFKEVKKIKAITKIPKSF